MKFNQALLPVFISLCATVSIASPTNSHEPTRVKRDTTVCGQYDTIETGSWIIYNDLWGEAEATSGSQCVTLDTVDGDTVSWSTSWTWAGGTGHVKSFADAEIDITSQQLSDISSIETSWKWSYTGTDIVADVAYDTFTSSTSDGSAEYEIMVWLAALGGAGPISSTGSTVATPSLNDVTWDLYSGPNGDTTVYSFVAQSEQTDFSGNLLDFYQYLEEYFDLSSSQYLISIQAGSEAFTGTDAVLTVSSYSITVA